MNQSSRPIRRSPLSRLIAPAVFVVVSVFCGSYALAASGDPIVRDQYHPGNNSGLATVKSNREVAQTFSVNFTGRLERVEVYLNDTSDSSDVLWDIRSTVGGVPLTANSSVLASGTIPGSAVPIFPDLPPLALELGGYNIAVQPGQIFAVTLRTATTTGMVWRVDGSPNQGVYQRTTSTAAWTLDTFWGNQSLGFATYIAIPEPSTLALLSIICAVACGRRRRSFRHD